MGIIREQLSGGAPPVRRAVKDEWAAITKYEVNQNALLEKKMREKEMANKKKMKAELDAQVEQKLTLKMSEKEREAFFASLEAQDVEAWRFEEQAKLVAKKMQAEKLKSERNVQLGEQNEQQA